MLSLHTLYFCTSVFFPARHIFPISLGNWNIWLHIPPVFHFQKCYSPDIGWQLLFLYKAIFKSAYKSFLMIINFSFIQSPLISKFPSGFFQGTIISDRQTRPKSTAEKSSSKVNCLWIEQVRVYPPLTFNVLKVGCTSI